jgi:hypothetical protein
MYGGKCTFYCLGKEAFEKPTFQGKCFLNPNIRNGLFNPIFSGMIMKGDKTKNSSMKIICPLFQNFLLSGTESWAPISKGL